jgi:carboxypeptidase D
MAVLVDPFACSIKWLNDPLHFWRSSSASQAEVPITKGDQTKLVMSRLSLLALLSLATASLGSSHEHPRYSFDRRQLPQDPTGVKTIETPNGVTIRYKEPGKEGVCETTPGVNSYSGYVDLSPESHTFFYFFEARNNPATAPITLWLNGGPGSDSLIGLFEGLYHRALHPSI